MKTTSKAKVPGINKTTTDRLGTKPRRPATPASPAPRARTPLRARLTAVALVLAASTVPVSALPSGTPFELLRYDLNNQTATDVTGNGNHGIVTGSPTFTKGEIDGAVSFNNPSGGSNATQFVTVPNTAAIQGLATTSFTVGIKYKSTDAAQQNGRIAGDGPDLTINYNANGHPNANGGVAGQGLNWPPPASPNAHVTDGAWHWQVIVVDRSSNVGSLYVDGNLVATAAIPSGTSIVLDNFRIGGNGSSSGGTSHGYAARQTTVDEFVVWSDALDETQVRF